MIRRISNDTGGGKKMPSAGVSRRRPHCQVRSMFPAHVHATISYTISYMLPRDVLLLVGTWFALPWGDAALPVPPDEYGQRGISTYAARTAVQWDELSLTQQDAR